MNGKTGGGPCHPKYSKCIDFIYILLFLNLGYQGPFFIFRNGRQTSSDPRIVDDTAKHPTVQNRSAYTAERGCPNIRFIPCSRCRYWHLFIPKSILINHKPKYSSHMEKWFVYPQAYKNCFYYCRLLLISSCRLHLYLCSLV